MKAFRIFIKKEFLHIFRDKRTLLILFGMPVVQVVLFGFAISNEINDAKIMIVDQAHDEASVALQNKLLSSGYFQLGQKVDDPTALEPVFQARKMNMAVVIPPGFGRDLYAGNGPQLQLVADASDPNTANLLIGYASAIIRDYQLSLAPQLQGTPGIQTEVRMQYNPELKSVFMFVPGVITIILMLVSAMMTSIAVAREKELGTMEILLVSPLHPALIILGKVIPYLFLSIINATVILLLGVFVFGMPIEGSVFLLMAQCTLFVITSLSLGILISTVAQSQQTAMMFSLMGLMLPTIILSGFIFPIENMPGVLQVISNIIPAKWFIIIVKDIMLKGAGMEFIWQETLILVGMTLLLIMISIRKFKIRLE